VAQTRCRCVLAEVNVTVQLFHVASALGGSNDGYEESSHGLVVAEDDTPQRCSLSMLCDLACPDSQR
jgi:hypothetical protein